MRLLRWTSHNSGNGNDGAVSKAAHLAIRRHMLGVDAHTAAKPLLGQVAAGDLALEHRVPVQRRKHRWAVEGFPFHAYAPSTLCPHTRSAWPLTAPEPG